MRLVRGDGGKSEEHWVKLDVRASEVEEPGDLVECGQNETTGGRSTGCSGDCSRN